jgi:hypothetical protein
VAGFTDELLAYLRQHHPEAAADLEQAAAAIRQSESEEELPILGPRVLTIEAAIRAEAEVFASRRERAKREVERAEQRAVELVLQDIMQGKVRLIVRRIVPGISDEMAYGPDLVEGTKARRDAGDRLLLQPKSGTEHFLPLRVETVRKTSKLPRGRPGKGTVRRVKQAMLANDDPDKLGRMKEKEMEDEFKASRWSCRKARDALLSPNWRQMRRDGQRLSFRPLS